MLFDSVIIGGGPAGMTAALYLARFGLSVAIIEKMTFGGLVLQTADIENYPGFANGIKGYEFVDGLEAQLAPYNIKRFMGNVLSMDVSSSVKRIFMEESTIEANSVIISSGVKYRKLGLPDEDRLLGKGLSHCALCDGQFFRNKVIGVVGGGNSALEESIFLSKIGSRVHLIHRRDSFRGASIYLDKLEKQGNVLFELSETVSALHGDDFLSGVTLTSTKTGEKRDLDIDALFIFAGFLAENSFIPQDILLDQAGFILTDQEMNTNVSGVFAAGDIRSKLCRQVVTAVGDGATAANSAYIYLEKMHA